MLFYALVFSIIPYSASSPYTLLIITGGALAAFTFISYFSSRIGRDLSNELNIILHDLRNLTERQGYTLPSHIHAQNEIDELKTHLRAIFSEMEKKQEEFKIAKQIAEKTSNSKSEFIAHVSHELRTPMHSILSYTKILLKKIDSLDKNEIANHLLTIEESSNRLLSNLNDILDLSKIEAGKMCLSMSVINMHDLIEDVNREIQSCLMDKNIELIIQKKARSTIAECDQNKMMQVIRNLIYNAVKFTDRGGQIVIRSENQGTAGIKFSFEDNGIGIPEEELNLIFEKYMQGTAGAYTEGSSGLGLYLCHKIVESHNGRIWAESRAEGGSRFCFTIPRKQPLQEAA